MRSWTQYPSTQEGLTPRGSTKALGQGDRVEHGDFFAIDLHQTLIAQIPQQTGNGDPGRTDRLGNRLVGEAQINRDALTAGDAKIAAEHQQETHQSGRHIPVGFAKDYYDEVALGIDFTARDVQSQLKAKGLPWEKAKGFDHSAAISAFIPLNKLTNEGSEGIYAATFSLEKNGMVVQSGNTNQMIHNVDEIIAHVSEYFSLRIGDYIYTGTPAGVGAVKSGDQLKGFLAGKEMFNFVVK